MNIKKQGQILELDPKKQYVMVIRRSSSLAEKILRVKKVPQVTRGEVVFVDDFDDFEFIENSDRIVDIQIK